MAMRKPTYLGIDLGTTSLKCIIADEKQKVVGVSEVRLAMSRKHPLWSEQNPDAWWLGLQKACKALRAAHGPAWEQIAAIG